MKLKNYFNPALYCYFFINYKMGRSLAWVQAINDLLVRRGVIFSLKQLLKK